MLSPCITLDFGNRKAIQYVYNPPMSLHRLQSRLRAALLFMPSSSLKVSLVKLWIYIDGFNLYNGALRGSPYKWLDLHAFAQALRPADEIMKVKYFTAQVDRRFNDPQQRVRQRLYWRAIRTLPTVEIIEGHFKTRTTWLP